MDSNTTEEIKRYLDYAVAGLRADIEGVGQHTDEVAEGLKAELRAEIRDVKRHSDVVAESLRSEILLVAEGVAGLDEKFTKEFVNVRTEIREQIGDVKALLRGSYRNLDRRVTKKKPS